MRLGEVEKATPVGHPIFPTMKRFGNTKGSHD